MKQKKGTLRICDEGHRYYKSSDCPVCPQCEAAREPNARFLLHLVRPAQRALENAGIDSLKKLSRYTEGEILSLHGMGPSSMPVLRRLLREAGLAFREGE